MSVAEGMTDQPSGVTRGRVIGGGALLLATVLFVGVFGYLAIAFGYPDVLDLDAAEVLPRLLALGATGRAVWTLYGLVPLLLVPTVVGLGAVTGAAAPLATRGATMAGVAAAFSMTLGLLRWPSLHWQLALEYAGASPARREAIDSLFRAANSYLGTFVGEFVGELALNTFFALAAYALAQAARPRRQWVAPVGAAASVLGFVAMFRNVTPAVALPADVNNVVLPVWMALLGYVLLTHPVERQP